MRRLVLLAWLPLVFFLLPRPPQRAEQLVSELHMPQARADAIQAALWADGNERPYLGLVVVSYLRARIVPEGLLFFETESNFLRILQLNLRLIEAGIANGSIKGPAWTIYNELFMPMFQAAVLVWVLWSFSTKRADRQ